MITATTRVWKVFTTQDGQEFTDIAEAQVHSAKLELDAWFDKTGVGRGGNWDADMICDTMLQNYEELAAVFEQLNSGNYVHK